MTRPHSDATVPVSAHVAQSPSTVSRCPVVASDSFLERAALAVLLALIPLRAVLSETPTFEVARTLRTLDVPAGADPATTFAVTSVIFAVATFVVCQRLLHGVQSWNGGQSSSFAASRPRLQATGAEWGALVLLIAMAVSTQRAGQKHLALIGCLDFLGLLVYLFTLRQLLTRPWHVRLALTVVLATGGMMIAKCAYQRSVEFPQTLLYYQEHRDEILSSRQANEGFIHDYEKRLESGSVTGYFNHPNILASYLILVAMTGLAVARGRLGRLSKWTLIGPGLIGLGATITLISAQSKGAAAALAIAILFYLVARLLRRLIAQHPWRAVAVCWLSLCIGAAGLVGVLNSRPKSLGLSMLYRWLYWQGAADMIRDQGPLGVGANNFSRFFTRYKPLECPEDVEDPHSWPVRAAADWGALGLVGLLLVLIGISMKAAKDGECGRPARLVESPWLTRSQEAGVRNQEPNLSAGGSTILWSAAIAGIFFAAWLWVLRGAAPSFLLVTFHIPAICWFLVFVLSGIDGSDAPRFSDGPLGPVLVPLCGGLFGFLAHTGIDLAFFHGGAATTFFALIAVVLAIAHRGTEDEPLDRKAPADSKAGALLSAPPRPLGPQSSSFALPAAIGIVAAVGIAYMTTQLTLPAAIVAGSLQTARVADKAPPATPNGSAVASDMQSFVATPQYHAYRRAVAAYPLDATALDELAEVLAGRARTVQEIDGILAMMDDFRRRDPHNAAIMHHRAMLHFQRYAAAARIQTPGGTQSSSFALRDLDQAVAFMREAVAAYPTHPMKHIYLADLLEKRAAATNNAADRQAAANELETALDLDRKRIYVSPPNHLSMEKAAQIMEHIRRLKSPES